MPIDLEQVSAAIGGHFERLGTNPLITPKSKGLERQKGRNINGPSVIRVPSWVEDPLGKYYLYFGHHQGHYIRLAYAENIEGPYTVHEPGTLQRDQTPATSTHIASPDVHVMEERQEIWMWYHGAVRGTGNFTDQGQVTFLARSKDGLSFKSDRVDLAPFYLRVFQYEGWFYGIAKNDNKDLMLLRSPDGMTPFERGTSFLPNGRHVAVLPKDHVLWTFYTRVGEAPEHIYFSTIDLTKSWQDWKPTPGISILEPEYKWEGRRLRAKKSRHGSTGATRALRDPAVFHEKDTMYLFYSIKGEKGIGVARLAA